MHGVQVGAVFVDVIQGIQQGVCPPWFLAEDALQGIEADGETQASDLVGCVDGWEAQVIAPARIGTPEYFSEDLGSCA